MGPIDLHRRGGHDQRRASALVLTLFAILMVSGLVVATLLLARNERSTSHLSLARAESTVLADIGANAALAQLREATEDGLSTGKMWISEPGRIRVYQRSNLSQVTDYDLFSALPGPDSTTVRDQFNTDLNLPDHNGVYPIANPAPGNGAATMKVGWVNLVADPSQDASADNPLIGRIAYWVDDESCKININTADGSRKYTNESFGFGTPGEISLQALENNGVPLTADEARDIADYAWERGFNTAAEVGRVDGIPDDFYQNNRFNITHYSKTPELTFFGEPRIYLFPIIDIPSTGEVRNHNAGAYLDHLVAPRYERASSESDRRTDSGDIDFIYPTSRQLPDMQVTDTDGDGDPDRAEAMMQYPSSWRMSKPLNIRDLENDTIYPFLSRIARAIQGYDSQASTFNWPAFPGASSAGFDAKYNDRQIDAIVLSIFDLATIAVSANQGPGYTYVTYAPRGMLSKQRVVGVNRGPKFTEFTVTFNADSEIATFDGQDTANPIPFLQVSMEAEFYFPAEQGGDDILAVDFQVGDELYPAASVNRFTTYKGVSYRTNDLRNFALNQRDHNAAKFGAAAPMGGYWDDKLLRITDQATGGLAGIDLRGHHPNLPDPDPTKSASYKPYANGFGGSDQHTTSATRAVLGTHGPVHGTNERWSPGDYHGCLSFDQGATALYASEGITTFGVEGGITFEGRNQSGYRGWDMTPLDSARSSFFTNEDPSDPTVQAELLEAVIPVPPNATIPVPSLEKTWTGRVSDPLVNRFPGDWEVFWDDATVNSEITLTTLRTTPPSIYQDGHNPGLQPTNGGDPLSLWLPYQDITYPKQSRFPSVGAFNVVRTGIIPDDLSVPLQQQHGTPWRSINFSASTSASQDVAASYPDWAMLDLFTVPYTPQLPYTRSETATPLRTLTYGGATEGKLNINNPKIPYPFNQTIPGVAQTPPERTSPLKALFYGVRTSTSYDTAGNPVYATVDATAAQNLAKAVQDYLENEGPFLLPGQLAEVPAINTYTYDGVAVNARSRNDMMREVVGATTTQSNVFSIWVVAQSIKKNPNGADQGSYESGDTITSVTRRRYIVERHIDYGIDNVPGNANDPGTDGVIGTEDDPIDDDYHPAMTYPLPYKWRIIAVEEMGS